MVVLGSGVAADTVRLTTVVGPGGVAENAFLVHYGTEGRAIRSEGAKAPDVFLANGNRVPTRETFTGEDRLLLSGSGADDRLPGTAGADRIDGEGGADYLDGGAGNDVLFGGVGNDVLVATAGLDGLSGGNGDDLYRVGPGIDSVALFDTGGNDRLLLDFGISFSGLTIGQDETSLRIDFRASDGGTASVLIGDQFSGGGIEELLLADGTYRWNGSAFVNATPQSGASETRFVGSLTDNPDRFVGSGGPT